MEVVCFGVNCALLGCKVVGSGIKGLDINCTSLKGFLAVLYWLGMFDRAFENFMLVV